MTWRKVVIAAIVVLGGTVGGLYWYLTRPIPIVTPTAALYDGHYDNGGHYSITRFNIDGRHRFNVHIFAEELLKKEPGTYPITPIFGVHVLTTQWDNPLPQYGRKRGPLDYLLQLLRINQGRNNVAQFTGQPKEAVLTIHEPLKANGRCRISVELKDLMLTREVGRKSSRRGVPIAPPEQCKIDLIQLGPVDFGK